MVLQLLQPCISSAPTVYLARLTADQLLEPDPQCARRLAYRLFRIFTRRILRISAISRRGAAAYGDDNTFLFWAKTLERACGVCSPRPFYTTFCVREVGTFEPR